MSNAENYIEIFFKGYLSFSEFRHLFITNWQVWFCESSEDKILFNILKKYWQTENKIPTQKDLELLFTNDKKFDKVREALLKKVLDVYSLDIVEYTESFLRDFLLEKLRNKKVKSAITKMIEQIQNTGKIDELKVKDEILKSLDIDNDADDLGIDYFNTDVAERMLLLQEQQRMHFKTGFCEFMDMKLKLKRKTMVAVSAQLGVGKSLFMNNLAVKFANDGYNVLYLSLEMDALDITQRFDKIYLDFENDDYFNDVDIVEKKMVAQLNANQKRGKLFVKAYPPRSLAAFQIKALLERYRLKNNGIDVILVDYLTIMRPNIIPKYDNSYEKGKNIAEELQGIAKGDNLLIFTALQVKGEAYGKKKQGAELVAESLAIPQLLDGLINMREWIDEVSDQKYLIFTFEKLRGSKPTKKRVYLKLLDNLKIVETTEAEKIKLEELSGKKTQSKVDPQEIVDDDPIVQEGL